ncbi:MAG: MATE family efflux transporter, partial [Clostridia bacterium]|nr:MATE family efflux transporter [Clostridia bacterium]
VNSFGPVTMEGRAAGASIEACVYTSMNSFYQATLTCVSQNYGAKQEKRIYKSIGVGMLCASIVGAVMGFLAYIFGEQLLSLYIVNSAEAMREGMVFITMCGLPYFICGIMEVTTGALRGLGHSKTPAINSLIGACGLRLLWIFFVLPFNHKTWFLYLCWPISWVAVIILNAVNFMIVRKKSIQKMLEQ